MEVSKEREGLNALLNRHSDRDVVKVERNQVWLLVDIEAAADDVLPFAIWRYTGNVYKVDPLGAVEDDPFLVVTPL